MLIGYDLIGEDIFNVAISSINNVTNMSTTGSVIDEVHLQTSIVNSPVKQSWTNRTILLALYNGDLEAGNILMREKTLDKVFII